MTVEKLRDATVNALRRVGSTNDETDERLLKLQAEVDDLSARVTDMEARLANLE